MFSLDGSHSGDHRSQFPNVALNRCIIYNAVKNTQDPDNVDLPMVNPLDCSCRIVYNAELHTFKLTPSVIPHQVWYHTECDNMQTVQPSNLRYQSQFDNMHSLNEVNALVCRLCLVWLPRALFISASEFTHTCLSFKVESF